MLDHELSTLSSRGKILVIGDLNSRTGELPDYIKNDSLQINNFDGSDLLPPDCAIDIENKRINQDKVLNTHGKNLLDLCLASGLRIDSALRWYISLDDDIKGDYDLSKESFQARFQPDPRTKWQRTAELYTVTHNKSTVEDYIARLTTKTAELQLTDEQTFNIILNGLKPCIRQFVLKQNPGFDFEVIHKPRKQHQNADVLSRIKYPDNEQIYDCDISTLSDTEPAIVSLEYKLFEQFTTQQGYPINSVTDHSLNDEEIISMIDNRVDEIKQLQSGCPDLKFIYAYLFCGELPDNKQSAIKVVVESEQYALLDGILYHFKRTTCKELPKNNRLKHQLTIPKSLRLEVMKACHDSNIGGAHQGFDRTYSVVSSKYYWPKMYANIPEYVKTCEKCQLAKQQTLHPLPPVSTFERWHMDILGPLTATKDKYQYVLLCVDSFFSRFPEAFSLKSQEATEIAEKLYTEITCRYGCPSSFVSYRGRNFLSNVIAELCKRMDIKHYKTSSYHPVTNSTCERYNRTLAQSLRTYIDETQENWSNMLPGILMAYRKTDCIKSTGFSPFHMLFGQNMRSPLGVT
ncbi:unnamed protein product [Mytilus coruscus]|uniref:Integrase catalytic domain-containing protein n=1 Tax=Mytilus coruscus TaxID=42192 RepID=A0A6J8C553_MYTCO|nr:unnamed protein product [Mytilus coruscus]